MGEQTTTTITISTDNLRGGTAPLYHQYPMQHQPQPAYVQMTENGAVSADWSGEIGGGTPMDVWHNRTLRWTVPANVRGDVLADLLESERVFDLLERVWVGHSVEWDGNNHVGKLDEDATEACDALNRIFGDEGYPGEWSESDGVAVWSLGDWFGNVSLLDVWPADKSFADAITENEAEMSAQNAYTKDDMGSALLSMAESRFDVDEHDKIAAVHVEALLKDGRITDDQADEWKANA